MLRIYIQGKGLRTGHLACHTNTRRDYAPALTRHGFGIHRKHESEVSERRKPQTQEWWNTELPNLWTDQITFSADRGRGDKILVTFTLFPLQLQKEVRRLWRDPAGGTHKILPTQFTVGIPGDYALRDSLNLLKEDEERPSGWLKYTTGELNEGQEDFRDTFRELMRSGALCLRRLWRMLWGNPEPAVFLISKLLKILVSAAGFEPATHALKGHCSTN